MIDMSMSSQGVDTATSSVTEYPKIADLDQVTWFVGVVETVALKNGVFVPCRKQLVLTKIGKNSDSAFCPHKLGILPHQTRKSTKMAGVTQAK